MLWIQIRYVLHNLSAIKQAVEEANEQILVHCCSKNSLEAEVGQQADVYCEGENGEKFIVEMQNAYQTYFKDRALFYSTFPIREQAQKIRHHVQLCDTATHKVFYNKLEYIYVEISKFNKPLEELNTLYEKWLYALKNLYKLTQRPKELCDKVFDRLFEEAEIAKFTPQEMREYETSKMAYRDIKNSVDTAKREGIAEGMEKGMELGMAKGKQEGLAEGMEKGMAKGMEKGMNQKALEIAKNMLAMGLSAEQVAKATQLPLEIIKNLSNS